MRSATGSGSAAGWGLRNPFGLAFSAEVVPAGDPRGAAILLTLRPAASLPVDLRTTLVVEVADPELAEPPGAEEVLGLLDLRRAEVGSRRSVHGLEQAPGAHDQDRGLRHHQRCHHGDGKAEPLRHRIDDTPPCGSPSPPTSTATSTPSRP